MRTLYTDRYLVADRCLELLYSNDLETLELSFWGFLTVNTAKVPSYLGYSTTRPTVNFAGKPTKRAFLAVSAMSNYGTIGWERGV